MKWREACLGLFVALCGAILAVAGSGVMAAIGLSVAIVGGLLIFAGMQRSRFRTSGETDIGRVIVDEQMVTFYGPRDGGAVTIDAMEFVQLDPTQNPPAWILQEVGGHPVTIPTDADGAEKLFDVFSRLKGIQTENIAAKISASPDEPVLVWHETQRRMH